MDRLVNDLLTLARLDEGVPMETAPVELVSLASDAVRTATAVGPEWPVQFWAARPVEVIGDKDRLRQVLDNLLANVRAHTPSGTSATVHVDQFGDQALIEVRDTGPGMPDEDARRVFERFYRADQARSRTARWQRARAVHRRRHRGGPRRDRLGRLRARPGAGGHRPAPVGAAPAGPRPGPVGRVDPALPADRAGSRGAPPAIHTRSTAGLHEVRRRAGHHA